MLSLLFGVALATLLSEDLACVAAGVLIAQGNLGFAEGTTACMAGIFAGDMMLFGTGRLIGERALDWPTMAKYLRKDHVDRAAAWLNERGLIVVLLSRFTPGLRLPTYFAAGLLPTPAAAFICHFLIAAAIWTPMLVGSTVILGDRLLHQFFSSVREPLIVFVAIFSFATLALHICKPLLNPSTRRRFLGRWMRVWRWEFWPAWLAYLPVVPYLVLLMIRYRSITLFTSTNPGIASGGFAGESKFEILSQLGNAAADYTLIENDLPPRRKFEAAHQFLLNRGLEFPVVLKPDVGERGSGVAVVRNEEELEAYLRTADVDTILQRYVPGEEFGIFYYRYPNEQTGRIFSITEKRFPFVIGDGASTLRDLILSDARAVCLADVYEGTSKRPIDSTPQAGELVGLVELGSHCRGAVFLNGKHLKTEALEQAIDRISRSFSGFFLGRFDIRTPSVELLQQGTGFSVIELNGVSAEATHIYDPSVSLIEAYRVLCTQWRIAFQIGAANRARGFRPMPVADLVKLVATWLSRPSHVVS